MNSEDLKFWKSPKSYPDHWQAYCKSFAEKGEVSYLVFDCETTGLEPKKDVILSIGGVFVQSNRIPTKKSFEFYLKQDYFDENSVKIHGIVQESSEVNYLSEEEAIKQFLSRVRNSILVGHHVSFDLQMINQALNRLQLPSLKNKSIDTNSLYRKKHQLPTDMQYSLDELCEKFGLQTKARHSALGDAYLTALVFLKLKSL